MLQITIPAFEVFDERTNTFESVGETKLQLEHSLISLSKWEQKWGKPFLGRDEKTMEQCEDYVRCMTLTKNVNPIVYLGLTAENYGRINEYIEAPMTATWFTESENRKFNREIITAEIIYYWMISLNIPFECQKWHLNTLLTLIRVCNTKNAPKKKQKGMGLNRASMSRRAALNKARCERLNTTG